MSAELYKYVHQNIRTTQTNETIQAWVLELLTKVDVIPAKAPAASLPATESSPFSPLNIFCEFKK